MDENTDSAPNMIENPATSETKEHEDNENANKNTTENEMSQSNETENDSEEYEVEKIVAHELQGGEIYYLVKWCNYDDSYNTWEPQTGLYNSLEAVTAYWETVPSDIRNSLFGKTKKRLHKRNRLLRHNTTPQQTNQTNQTNQFAEIKKTDDYRFSRTTIEIPRSDKQEPSVDLTKDLLKQLNESETEDTETETSGNKVKLAPKKYKKHKKSKKNDDNSAVVHGDIKILGAFKKDKNIIFVCSNDGNILEIPNEAMKKYYCDVLIEYYENCITMEEKMPFKKARSLQ